MNRCQSDSPYFFTWPYRGNPRRSNFVFLFVPFDPFFLGDNSTLLICRRHNSATRQDVTFFAVYSIRAGKIVKAIPEASIPTRDGTLCIPFAGVTSLSGRPSIFPWLSYPTGNSTFVLIYRKVTFEVWISYSSR